MFIDEDETLKTEQDLKKIKDYLLDIYKNGVNIADEINDDLCAFSEGFNNLIDSMCKDNDISCDTYNNTTWSLDNNYFTISCNDEEVRIKVYTKMI